MNTKQTYILSAIVILATLLLLGGALYFHKTTTTTLSTRVSMLEGNQKVIVDELVTQEGNYKTIKTTIDKTYSKTSDCISVHQQPDAEGVDTILHCKQVP